MLNNKDNSPIDFRSSSEWKSIVAQKRQEVLDEHVGKLPQRITSSDGKIFYGPISNNVKIVDKWYFQKSCKVIEWHSTMNKISNEYSLNEEQLRAFNIVTNHIALNEQEPLKIYIGGMGGTGKS